MIDSRLEQYARVAAVALLALGCFLVLEPFLGAILFAGILSLSTWPFYAWLRMRLGGRSWLAAVILVTLLVIALALPIALGAQGIVAHSGQVVELFRGFLERRETIELPGWVRGIPGLGQQIDEYVRAVLAGSTELTDLLRGLSDPAKAFMLAVGRAVGQGVVQVLIAIFVVYFFYRDGERVGALVVEAVRRIAGPEQSEAIVVTASNAVRGVVYGLIGTAFAQAAVALVGFLIAGVPGAFLLAAVTFILSLVPLGTVIIWGGVAAWLYFHGEVGMTIFMVIWGVAVISSVDNFIKPMLMSRAGNLSMLLVVLGVFGGAVAFGFIGLFIGPALLAVAWNVLGVWLDMPAQRKAEGGA